MDPKIDEIVNGFEEEATEDIIGLWEVIGSAEDLLGGDNEEDVLGLAFQIVETMLSRGFRAGYMAGGGSTIEPWPDQSPNSVVARIASEWKADGRIATEAGVWFERVENR